jgi:hypothetical protein
MIVRLPRGYRIMTYALLSRSGTGRFRSWLYRMAQIPGGQRHGPTRPFRRQRLSVPGQSKMRVSDEVVLSATGVATSTRRKSGVGMAYTALLGSVKS